MSDRYPGIQPPEPWPVPPRAQPKGDEAMKQVVNEFHKRLHDMQVFDRITVESVRHALGEAIGRRVREYE